jgi:hypothetical protein
MATYQTSILISFTAENTTGFNLLSTKVNQALNAGRINEVVNSDPQAKIIQIRIVDTVELN